MIGWKKIWKQKSWNPERVSSVFTFVSVCTSVCERATEYTFWPRNLMFGLKDPWDMGKKRIFGPILDDMLKATNYAMIQGE